MSDAKLSAVARKIERLGCAWHVGLAGLYCFAALFHAWCVYEHARVGFRRDGKE